MCLYYSRLFFFNSAGAPRHLHSFPTRRSSDLLEGDLRSRRCNEAEVTHGPTGRLSSPAARCQKNGPATTNDRSEEHTSELQSRRDLVCRLLLEKKKKKEHNIE